ncbi:MAG: TIM barrel protein [Candidatus Anstonellales archaeon]
MLLFGTAGIPLSSEGNDTVAGIKRVKELGLGAMELEFVRSVYVKSNEEAERIKQEAKKQSIRLSVHAPYFINLNASEKAKLEASKKRILDSAKAAYLCGANDIAIHSGFYLGNEKSAVYEKIKQAYKDIRKKMREMGIDSIILRPEMMGKPTQFADIDTIIRLCNDVEGLLPCIDYAHYQALYGEKVNNYDGFCALLDKIKDGLGKQALKNMHIQFSAVEYTDKGERNHTTFDEGTLRWKDMVKTWKHYKIEGIAISESPNIEGDAIKAMSEYKKA